MATMGTPASLGELIRGHGVSASLSLVLPEGLEIGHRYRVLRLLGIGGMGAVYRVRDKELDRDVALKLIRSEIADNPTTLERFKREIQLSSSVTHRNVLRVFDLGESDGIKFLTMQYVEGEDLGAIFKREKKLSWFIFDLFDEQPLCHWRYQDDPVDVRRPIGGNDEDVFPTI